MAKKNNKRKRPLKANPKRQAHAQLRGYLYQIWHSVHAWLDLSDDEILYLEGAEDFDKISSDITTVTQVKHKQNNITLRSEEVSLAISNYWKLKTNNRDQCVKFRFLTTSKIGKERGNPFGVDNKGIECWIRCSGDKETIKKIRECLLDQVQISDEVKTFLKEESLQDIYEQIIQPITWETGSKSISFVERSINDKLVLHGNLQPIPVPPSDSRKVVDPLLKEALKIATEERNRFLTKVRFLEIFEEQTTQRIPTHHLHRLQSQVTMMRRVGMSTFEGSSDIAIQFQSLIQTDIPQAYLDVLVPRTELLTSIQTRLQSEGISIIHGGAGKGKTTLAKLTANTISGKWLWQSFTNLDPLSKDFSLQVTQQLKQLAIAIHNASSQVNVVLDNLSLLSENLHRYKEDLGVVVYNVLKRGAKLLITSQHKPPPNFTPSLGLPSSIVIDVPNFTIPEIEQFAEQMGCPTNDLKTCVTSIQRYTHGHPKLVHARLVQLREKNWKEKHTRESLLQIPQEVKDERKAALQLVSKLPEDQQKFLYRLSLMHTVFRRDYALNIGEIPQAVQNPGIALDQLDGPWIDRVNETYFTISPLLTDAAKQVWPKNMTTKLHAQIANAILEADNLTTIEARSVFHHSLHGQNKKGLVSVIYSLIIDSEDNWENICQEFSWIRFLKTNPPEELFPGNFSENHMFRYLQYQFSIEVEPEFAPRILQIWDNETKKYESHQSYPQSRLMLATQALKYNQVQLSAKKLMSYLKEIYDIKNMDKKVWKSYFNSMEQLKENNIDESNIFSFLFSFIYMRTYINTYFLDDLIDALDKLQPEIRTLLLADFGENSIEAQLLISGVWLAEANLENPDWTRCLDVFGKVIEKAIEWGSPHIAAASAKGKAIIHDEKLNHPDTAHEVLQDIKSKVGTLPITEEAQAVVYLNQKRYQEALRIYERILPEWNPPSEQSNIAPSEEYRRAAICASNLDDWKKAANFLEVGAKKTQEIEDTDIYIGLYADAGFAYFKAGNMLDSIKLMTLALQKFEKLTQDNTDLKYYALKKRLAGSIGWIAYHEDENFTSDSLEPNVAFCSNQEINEEVLDLPDSPIEKIWLALARIECKFGNGITALKHSIQIAEKTTDPKFQGSLALLELHYDFRNKTLNKLPERIHHIIINFTLIQKHNQNKEEIEIGLNSISILEQTNFASVESITVFFIAGLLTQLTTNKDMHDILTIWRTNSLDLPIKENLVIALDLIESMLSRDQNNILTVMKTQDDKVENRLAASLKVVQSNKTKPEDLYYAHTYITTTFIGSPLENYVVTDLAKLISEQWLERTQFKVLLKTPKITVPQIEKACNSSETGKKKIGQILLAVQHAISVRIPSEVLGLFRTWTESQQKQEHATGKNPAAQRLIKAMEQPPHLTDEDIEALNQSIKEGEIPIKFDSPFEFDENE